MNFKNFKENIESHHNVKNVALLKERVYIYFKNGISFFPLKRNDLLEYWNEILKNNQVNKKL